MALPFGIELSLRAVPGSVALPLGRCNVLNRGSDHVVASSCQSLVGNEIKNGALVDKVSHLVPGNG